MRIVCRNFLTKQELLCLVTWNEVETYFEAV